MSIVAFREHFSAFLHGILNMEIFYGPIVMSYREKIYAVQK